MPDERRDQTEALRNITALETAEDRAYQRGQQSAKLRAQVDSHEKRLDAINGSIARSARAQESTNDRLDELKASVEKSTEVAKARADTAAELAAQAAKNAVDKRTFIITVVMAAAAIAGVLVAAIQLTGHA